MAVLTPEELDRRAAARVVDIGTTISANLGELTDLLHKVLSEEIEPLRGDQPILDLLHASIRSNLETLADIFRHQIPVEEVSAPPAAVEYGRRLAQRDITSLALVRAFRLGQEAVVNWSFDQLDRWESDPHVALATGRRITDLSFQYIDRVSELVVHVYETERERWLSNRNTVRAATLQELLAGERPDTGAAEHALGYRLRQRHLGVVLSAAADAAAVGLPQLERFLGEVARATGAEGAPLFFARDRTSAWGWVPLGLADRQVGVAGIGPAAGVQAAFGTPGSGMAGFRVTHLEASRARAVAVAAGDRALPVTSYGDPAVRTGAMLATDIEGTRRLVARSLGSLAADTEGAERLRATLQIFLAEKGSYTATADRVHLHKNTVKYRVDKAIEERGRPIDDDRLELELALLACEQLGTSVLRQE